MSPVLFHSEAIPFPPHTDPLETLFDSCILPKFHPHNGVGVGDLNGWFEAKDLLAKLTT